MCPESSEARQIRIYACRKFPLEWVLRAVIMEGVSAADSMLFKHGDRWWMLTNIDRSPSMDDHCYELHLFWAQSPLSTHWTPHAKNPVKVNSYGARNAGMAIRGQTLFRFGQCQGFDLYGEGLILHEITCLDENDYSERIIQQVLPRFKPGIFEMHHLTSVPSCTLFDHVSWTIRRATSPEMGGSSLQNFA